MTVKLGHISTMTASLLQEENAVALRQPLDPSARGPRADLLSSVTVRNVVDQSVDVPRADGEIERLGEAAGGAGGAVRIKDAAGARRARGR